MEADTWVALGFLIVGFITLATNIALGVRQWRKTDDDTSLAKLEAIVEAQGGWIVNLTAHAERCDARLERLDEFIRLQGLDPP